MSHQNDAPLHLSNPEGLYDPTENGYSHLAVIAPGSRLVFIAGQGGENVHGELPGDFHLQVRWALANLRVALNAAGGELSDIAKLTTLVVDHDEDKLGVLADEIREAWGSAPTPAQTLIPVPRLALDDMLFEVEAVAVLPNEAPAP
ncbi:RidA family protein [Marinobacter halodurans]|uniref:RidA family protein n=1 Tax=Marinobacter halodurans TaxID=2528979 RepID=A0ABY1ZJI2_9GAMM|nr:RidA family protein [Marinobacter halodurans]TBW55164.1 RidA family protein [Marinobacter halodurans]